MQENPQPPDNMQENPHPPDNMRENPQAPDNMRENPHPPDNMREKQEAPALEASTAAVLLNGGIRETLFAQPMIRALAGATIFARPDVFAALEGVPQVGRAVPVGDRLRDRLSVFRRLRGRGIDATLLAAPVSFADAATTFLAGVPYRFTLGGQQAWSATRVVRLPAGLHPVEAMWRLGHVFLHGDKPAASAPAPMIGPSIGARERMRDYLEAAGWRPGGRALVIVPGAGNWTERRPRRGWLPERFAVVANQTGSEVVLLVQGIGDEPAVRETRAGIRLPTAVIDLRHVSLDDFAAVMETGPTVVGPDGDLLHAAAAAGGRVVALLEPADIAPYGRACVAMRVPDLAVFPAKGVVEVVEDRARAGSYA